MGLILRAIRLTVRFHTYTRAHILTFTHTHVLADTRHAPTHRHTHTHTERTHAHKNKNGTNLRLATAVSLGQLLRDEKQIRDRGGNLRVYGMCESSESQYEQLPATVYCNVAELKQQKRFMLNIPLNP